MNSTIEPFVLNSEHTFQKVFTTNFDGWVLIVKNTGGIIPVTLRLSKQKPKPTQQEPQSLDPLAEMMFSMANVVTHSPHSTQSTAPRTPLQENHDPVAGVRDVSAQR